MIGRMSFGSGIQVFGLDLRERPNPPDSSALRIRLGEFSLDIPEEVRSRMCCSPELLKEVGVELIDSVRVGAIVLPGRDLRVFVGLT
jgi:hypothetical protein